MPNPSNIALTPEELREVTGYRLVRKQCHALALMQIPFKVRPDGSPFVARATIEGTKDAAESKPPEPVLTRI